MPPPSFEARLRSDPGEVWRSDLVPTRFHPETWRPSSLFRPGAGRRRRRRESTPTNARGSETEALRRRGCDHPRGAPVIGDNGAARPPHRSDAPRMPGGRIELPRPCGQRILSGPEGGGPVTLAPGTHGCLSTALGSPAEAPSSRSVFGVSRWFGYGSATEGNSSRGARPRRTPLDCHHPARRR